MWRCTIGRRISIHLHVRMHVLREVQQGDGPCVPELPWGTGSAPAAPEAAGAAKEPLICEHPSSAPQLRRTPLARAMSSNRRRVI